MSTELNHFQDLQSLSTADALIRAAAKEFNELGYYGTNTNKIAKTANFAPQTFYRHFDDKIEIFLAVYDYWQAEERQAIAKALKSQSPAMEIAKAIMNHHLTWRGFRRSLRLLATEEDRVRSARKQSRERQLQMLLNKSASIADERANLISSLLTIERLCDAAADQELQDLGLDEKQILALVTAAVSKIPSLSKA